MIARQHLVIILIAATGLLVQSCAAPVTSDLLEKKRQCEIDGKKFFEWVRSGGHAFAPGTEVSPEKATFAYNPALNTCLCAYQLVGSDNDPTERAHRIYDVYTHREIASFYFGRMTLSTDPAARELFGPDAVQKFREQYRDLFGVDPEWP